MNITGIIAEYNPFHNGHLYQIEQIRKKEADYIIIVMSGDFLQRGTPAILDNGPVPSWHCLVVPISSLNSLLFLLLQVHNILQEAESLSWIN